MECVCLFACVRLLAQGDTFVAVCPVPAVQKAVTRCLCRRRLSKCTQMDERCVIQWAPFSKIVWSPVLEGGQLITRQAPRASPPPSCLAHPMRAQHSIVLHVREWRIFIAGDRWHHGTCPSAFELWS